MNQNYQRISLILLLISGFGVLFSGPLILGWVSIMDPFWDFGNPWREIGGYLDIIGGLLQLTWVAYMIRKGYFSKKPDLKKAQQGYKIMAILCIIGLIADPLGGLLALSAQLGFYTSLVNIYWHR